MSSPTDPAPLLPPSGRFPSRRLPSLTLRGAVRFLQRNTSNRRAMSEPSMLVREAAAEQLDERQGDWAYSKPVVVLDTVWNLAFVAAALAVFGMSWREKPGVPLRLWIAGYALQCLLHVACVVVEYRRRIARRLGIQFLDGNLDQHSVIRHLESANTMFSFLWWIIGFYWVSAGGQDLINNAPQLYWLCIVFLAFDVFFVVFCVALACFIGIAVCCCLPCIIALLYAVVDQEGASDEDIGQLPKYKFSSSGTTSMAEVGTDQPHVHTISEEDAECCICLSAYDDGVMLRELPCGHHFHCSCIDKWLRINAICPLCKYNILKPSFHAREDV
ncbi:E3 ubiquitin-protein ligase [Rhynchospora pubera]|uniref:RING-type E3 ubiquitin transferase n=1 Tax=Rhynchospora pubera TaxID=906938 RepID=A0AAV8CQK4_9POAL|nr:E3 ubiquitin-protein ligase [Rhynchospora pubera]